MEKIISWGLLFMAAYTLYAVTLGQHMYVG
jgi:hypothetical protein